MWRREERLAYWLSKGQRLSDGQRQSGGRSPSEGQNLSAGQEPGKRTLAGELKDRLLGKWRPDVFPCTINAAPLDMNVRTASLDALFSETVEIKDGLADLNPAPAFSSRLSAEMEALPIGIHDVDLLFRQSGVRNVNLPDERQARIQTGSLLSNPKVRLLAVRGIQSAVHSAECIQSALPAVKNGGRWIFENVKVESLGSKLADMPYRRMSLDISLLNESERQGFLREAAVQRRIPMERSELLAVFRSVPIEMISRLHFLAGKRMIVYRLAKGMRRTQTRVHDMAAIRDKASQETFLVPHRSQYRVVSLSE